MKKYRPVSKLSFLSRLVERCMLRQLISHCNTNSFIPKFQPAYRGNYSMETSLIIMCNDILWSTEKQQITMMVIFDLSAAFDTVDHDILLNILQNHYGITDKALQWFNNYLWPWHFKVSIRNNYSKPQQLYFSVPQGSCSWANIFTCYSTLIDKVVPGDIMTNGFTDDHSLRKWFNASDTKEEKYIKEKPEATIATIKSRMDKMRLKLNAEKNKVYSIWLQNSTEESTHIATHYLQWHESNELWSQKPRRNTGHDAQLQQICHHENKESHDQLHMHKSNMKIPLQICMHHTTSTHVMHMASGLWQCITVKGFMIDVLLVHHTRLKKELGSSENVS